MQKHVKQRVRHILTKFSEQLFFRIVLLRISSCPEGFCKHVASQDNTYDRILLL